MKRPLQPDGPLVGCLQGVDIPVLIREIHRRGASGKLHVERRGVLRTLFFNDGTVRFADSSNPNDRLGERMLRLGQITVRVVRADAVASVEADATALLRRRHELGSDEPEDFFVSGADIDEALDLVVLCRP